MKTKVLLLIFLGIHIACVLFVNTYALQSLKPKNTIGVLNPVGAYCIEHINLQLSSEFIANFIDGYTNLTGTDRGYEFFSPNISRKDMNLVFISDTGEELQMMQSIEAEIKTFTAISYFNMKILDDTDWHTILRSICKRFFAKYPSVEEITVYADFATYPAIEEAKQCPPRDEERILISKVQYHDSTL